MRPPKGPPGALAMVLSVLGLAGSWSAAQGAQQPVPLRQAEIVPVSAERLDRYMDSGLTLHSIAAAAYMAERSGQSLDTLVQRLRAGETVFTLARELNMDPVEVLRAARRGAVTFALAPAGRNARVTSLPEAGRTDEARDTDVLLPPEGVGAARVRGYGAGEYEVVQPRAEALPPLLGDPSKLRNIPYEGALPPGTPPLGAGVRPNQKLEPWQREALHVLYARPMPVGPEPIPLEKPRAVYVEGRGPVIQVLPGPPVFPQHLPKMAKIALPKKVPFSNNVKVLPKGDVRLYVIDRTANDTKLSQDEMEFQATFTDFNGDEWKVIQTILAPISPDPPGEPWLGGVGTDVVYHGESGWGTPAVPWVNNAAISWGWADLWKNGQKIEAAAPLHVMVTSDTRNNRDGFKYYDYDSRNRPIKEIHLIVAPRVGLPTPGGFLHVMWEDAVIKKGSPEEIRRMAEAVGLDLPTYRLTAVPYLKWDKTEIEVPAGQRFRLIIDNFDPADYHGFMVRTPEGNFSLPLPHGSAWATTILFDKPGQYHFACPIDNHRNRGMHGHFIAKEALRTDRGRPSREGGLASGSAAHGGDHDH